MSRKLEDMLEIGVGSKSSAIICRELAIPLVAELLCAMKARESSDSQGQLTPVSVWLKHS